MKQPNSFFKFVTEDRADILANGMIRFTPSDQFNDPFELRPWVTHLSRCWIEHLRTNQPAALAFEDEDYRFSTERYHRLGLYSKKLESRSKEVGILSLSASYDTSGNPASFLGNPDDPRRNLLMWAHYGASHTGLVIEFRNNFLEEQAQEVLYSAERPIATFEDIDDEINVSHLSKSREWAYENEWRYFKKLTDAEKILFDDQNRSVHLFRFKKNAVKSVTFGCRASEKTKKSIIDILNSMPEYQDTATFFASIDQEQFGLSFHQEYHQNGCHWSNEIGMQNIHVQKKIGKY